MTHQYPGGTPVLAVASNVKVVVLLPGVYVILHNPRGSPQVACPSCVSKMNSFDTYLTVDKVLILHYVFN